MSEEPCPACSGVFKSLSAGQPPNIPAGAYIYRFNPEEPNVSSTNKGLFQKFNITRTDGSDKPGGKHYGCDYFVLDITHDPYAIPALLKYAKTCQAEYGQLHDDLMAKIEDRVKTMQAAVMAFVEKRCVGGKRCDMDDIEAATGIAKILLYENSNRPQCTVDLLWDLWVQNKLKFEPETGEVWL